MAVRLTGVLRLPLSRKLNFDALDMEHEESLIPAVLLGKAAVRPEKAKRGYQAL